MTDPYHKVMKKHKEYNDMLGFVADAHYGIPKECFCGGRIIDEVRRGEAFDTMPGKRVFTCVNFKDDGLHYRHPWVIGVQEEIERLTSRVEETEKNSWQVQSLNRQIETLKEEMGELLTRVVRLEKLCFRGEDSADSADGT